MKKLILFSVFAVVSVFGLQGFGNSDNSSPTILADSVCFSRDILPIINSNCAMSNCHDAISHKEGLTLTSYSGIMKGVRAGSANTSAIYAEIKSNGMPDAPYKKLTDAQKLLIKTWIDQGAKNSTCTPATCDTTSITYSNIKPIIRVVVTL